MHDIYKEKPLTLTEAAALVKSHRGRKTHTETLRRWAKKGRFGIKLEVIIGPGGMQTTAEAIARFRSAVDAETRRRQELPASVQLPDTVAERRRKADEFVAASIANSRVAARRMSLTID